MTIAKNMSKLMVTEPEFDLPLGAQQLLHAYWWVWSNQTPYQ